MGEGFDEFSKENIAAAETAPQGYMMGLFCLQEPSHKN